MTVDLFQMNVLTRAACDVKNTKSYSKGCEVSSCHVGWKVSADKTKCEGNKCSCPNGIASTGAKCVNDGSKICESCDPGFTTVMTGGSRSCIGELLQ